jgi:hypothetical protein
LIARYNGVARAAGGDSDERASVTIDADIDVHKAPALAQLDGAVAQLFDRLTRPVSDARRVFNWALRGRSA